MKQGYMAPIMEITHIDPQHPVLTISEDGLDWGDVADDDDGSDDYEG